MVRQATQSWEDAGDLIVGDPRSVRVTSPTVLPKAVHEKIVESVKAE